MNGLDDIRIDDHKLHMHPMAVAQWLNAQDNWEKAKHVYPIYVEVSPHGGCNFRCTFCAKDFLKYRPTRLEVDVLKRTFKVMVEKGVKSVLFAGEGEPTLHDELDEVFAYAAEIGLDTALNTNASVSNERTWRAATKYCKWIRASVNAGNAKVHSQLHQCREDVFDRVMSNLEKAVQMRNEVQSQCVIGAQAVLVNENFDSMVELAQRCREIQVDYLVIKPYSQHPESFTHKHEHADYSRVQELATALKQGETEKFKVFFRTSAFQRAQSTTHNYHRCHSVPNFWAYIRSTGDVSGCNAFLTDSKFHYGNINQSRFDEVWEGPLRQANFEHMKTHDISSCRINCRMEKVNEYLSSLKNPPLHVNYI